MLVLTGPPGAGKSTVAADLARRAERGVHLETDAFFRFFVSGYIEPWLPESHQQNAVAMAAVAEAAASYALGGYFTVVDGVVIPRWFLGPLRDILTVRGLRVAYAVLRVPLQACVRRVDQREGAALADPEVIADLWRQFADLGELGGHAVHVEELGPAAAADAVAAALEAGALTLPGG